MKFQDLAKMIEDGVPEHYYKNRVDDNNRNAKSSFLLDVRKFEKVFEKWNFKIFSIVYHIMRSKQSLETNEKCFSKWFISNNSVTELLTYVKGEHNGKIVHFDNKVDAVNYRNEKFPHLKVVEIKVGKGINLNSICGWFTSTQNLPIFQNLGI